MFYEGGQPLYGEDIQYMQNNQASASSDMLKSVNGGTYVLYGVNLRTTDAGAGTRAWDDGAISIGGELFHVSAGSLSLLGKNDSDLYWVARQNDAEETLFKDGSKKNVHREYSVTLSDDNTNVYAFVKVPDLILYERGVAKLIQASWGYGLNWINHAAVAVSNASISYKYAVCADGVLGKRYFIRISVAMNVATINNGVIATWPTSRVEPGEEELYMMNNVNSIVLINDTPYIVKQKWDGLVLMTMDGTLYSGTLSGTFNLLKEI
jgi:hypothetical protein